jgi:hypothetical protein
MAENTLQGGAHYRAQTFNVSVVGSLNLNDLPQ